MRRAGGILVLLVVAMALGGCLLRVGAPCAGYGCPAFVPRNGTSAQAQQAPVQTAQQKPSHHSFFGLFGHKAQAQSNSTPAPAANSGQ